MEEERKRTFDRVAEQYDAARPGYPEVAFADVEALSGIAPPARILEIGSGTGHATVAFARRGYRLVCIELGAQLAAVASKRLPPNAQVEIRVGAFETAELEARAYDLVLSASAFHWLDRAIAYPKVHRALRPGAALALVWTSPARHLAPSTPVLEAIQRAYDEHVPELAQRFRSGTPFTIRDELEQTSLFGPVHERIYEWERRYDADGYLALLGTFSDHIVLPESQREPLFRAIHAAISQGGGALDVPLRTLLYVAHASVGQ